MVRSEKEILEKLTFLEGQFANGNDPEAQREIWRLRWVLGVEPDHIHIPKAGTRRLAGYLSTEANMSTRELYTDGRGNFSPYPTFTCDELV